VRWTGYGVNPSGSDPWLTAIGKLVVNFGALEAQTYFWLAQLRGTVPLPDADMKRLFGPRVDTILSLVPADPHASPHLTGVQDGWDKAKELSKFRNQIAHSPIVFGWKGPENGAPDFLKVLDFKEGGSASGNDPAIELTTIHQRIDEVATVTEKLFSLYRLIWPSGEGAP
jgi:hypothetical protein